MGDKEILAWKEYIGFGTPGNVDFGPGTLARSIEIAKLAGIVSPVRVAAEVSINNKNDTPWMDIANGEIGQHEIRGGENPRILEYHAVTTLKAQEDEIPWCSAFVSWVLEKAGCNSTRNAWARSYENYGRRLSGPKIGAIVVFDWGDGSGHVGFVKNFGNSWVEVLGGNQSDAVNVTTFSRKNVSAWRWPEKG